MSGNDEAAFVLDLFGLGAFTSAADEAYEAIAPDERVNCAGVAREARLAGVSYLSEPGKLHYYVVTDRGLYFGLLLKKGGLFSKDFTENAFLAIDEIKGLDSVEGFVDVLGDNREQLAHFEFMDGATQVARPRGDGGPLHPGHQGIYSATEQLQNFASGLAAPLT